MSFSLFVLNCLIIQVLYSGSDYWLTLWTISEERRTTNGNFSITLSSPLGNLSSEIKEAITGPAPFTGDWWKDPDTHTGIYVFTILTVGVFIFSMIRTIHYFLLSMTSSINLHNSMFQSVIRSPLLFFDQNPVGNYCIFKFDLFLLFNAFKYRKSIKPFCQGYWKYGRTSSI